jgi:hypothetical protein
MFQIEFLQRLSGLFELGLRRGFSLRQLSGRRTLRFDFRQSRCKGGLEVLHLSLEVCGSFSLSYERFGCFLEL